MHYKNGREAKNGDLVIGKAAYDDAPVMSGLLIDINPGCTSCNGQLIRPGGSIASCVTASDFFPAEDALACIAAEWEKTQRTLADVCTKEVCTKDPTVDGRLRGAA